MPDGASDEDVSGIPQPEVVGEPGHVSPARDGSLDAAGPVGVVGVGALGADVARTLVDAGAVVRVHDSRPEAAASIEGAAAVEALADLAAGCPTMCVLVRDDAQVLDVVGPLAEAATAGSTILVHSTVSVEAIRAAATVAREEGVVVLDAGLCRPAGTGSGFVALVGGEPDEVARVRPVLGAIARRVHHVGPLGTGIAAKALRNMAVYGAYAAVAEAVDAARDAGVAADAMLAVLADTGAVGSAGIAFAGYREEWERGDHADAAQRAGFVDLARKDLGIASGLAAASRPTAFAEAVAEAMPVAYLTDAAAPDG